MLASLASSREHPILSLQAPCAHSRPKMVEFSSNLIFECLAVFFKNHELCVAPGLTHRAWRARSPQSAFALRRKSTSAGLLLFWQGSKFKPKTLLRGYNQHLCTKVSIIIWLPAPPGGPSQCSKAGQAPKIEFLACFAGHFLFGNSKSAKTSVCGHSGTR